MFTYNDSLKDLLLAAATHTHKKKTKQKKHILSESEGGTSFK